MTTYNTGNPVPSAAVKDLYDNSQTEDEFVNSDAVTTVARLGKVLKTMRGMNVDAANAIANGVYQNVGDYAAGLTIGNFNQTFRYLGEFYKAKPTTTLPYTMTGTPATDIPFFTNIGDSSLRAVLANPTDLSQGAMLVGRAAYVFAYVDLLRTTVGRYDGDVCILLGWQADGAGNGGGFLRWNASSTSNVGLNGQRFAVTGQPTGRWERFNTGTVSILDWGAYNDGNVSRTAVNNAAFQSARDYVAATLAELVFPQGGYCYTASPNWAINQAIITSRGRVDLIYTGAGNAVVIDAGATAPDLCFDMRMGYFTVKVGNAAALESVYVRSVHHSKLDFNIRSAGTGKAALKIDFAVCTEFNIISSSNEQGGWYAGLAPAFGMRLCQRLVGEQVAYCHFPNAVIEHQNTGIQLEQALGNNFIGGTSEGCVHGMILFAGALRNKVIGMDFEANTTADIEISGNENEFTGCDTEKSIFIGGLLNKIQGGSHQDVVVNAGASSNKLLGFTYNRSTVGGTLLDSGTNTRMKDLTNAASGLMHDSQPGVQSITVTASPFGFGNTRGNNVIAYVIGGTVSNVSITRSGGSPSGTGAVSGGFLLAPGDIITVTYSAAPTMYYSKV